jgi:hypothetical protein
MSDDNGKILHFPGKKKEPAKVPSLVSTMINDMFESFTPEQKSEFQGYMTTNLELRFSLTDDKESFRLEEIPVIEDPEFDIDLEDMAKMMSDVETKKDLAFEYIKQIELAMFDAHFAYDMGTLTEITNKLRIICTKLPQKG